MDDGYMDRQMNEGMDVWMKGQTDGKMDWMIGMEEQTDDGQTG